MIDYSFLDEKNVLDRAFTAYFRRGTNTQPSSASEIQTVNGKDYAVLRNGNGLLAVYRIRKDGYLRHVAVEKWKNLLGD